MENNFVAKFIMKGIENDIKKDITYKGKKVKRIHKLEDKAFFEIAKKITNKAIKVKIASINKRKLENIHKNEQSTKENNITKIENIKSKEFKGNYTKYLYEMLERKNKAFVLNNYKNVKTKEDINNFRIKYLQKQFTYKMIEREKQVQRMKTNTMHKSIMNYEDIAQTTFVLMLEQKHNMYIYGNKIIINKIAKKYIFRSLQKYLTSNMNYENENLFYYDYMSEEDNTSNLIEKQSYNDYIKIFNYVSRVKKSFTLDRMYKELKLTERQKQVIQLIANGLTQRNIANILGISQSTTKTTLARIKETIKEYYLQLA